MRILLMCALVCLLVLTAGSVYATNIPVLNPSFEAGDWYDPLDPRGEEAGNMVPTDWHLSYYSMSGCSSMVDVDAPDGDYAAVFSGWYYDAYIWQSLSVNFEPDTIYTLSAYARAYPGQQSWGAIQVRQPSPANEAHPAAWIAGPTAFTQWTYSVNTADNPSLVGQPITIFLFQKYVEGARWTSFMNYDMVTLSSTPVLAGSIQLAVTLEDYAQGNLSQSPVTVQVSGPMNRTEQFVLTSNPGQVLLTDLAVGTYDVSASACKWVTKTATGVVVSHQTTTPASVSLPNGDVDGDNGITTTDLSVVLKNMPGN